jgi:Flp pilus assembly protein TadD
VGVEAPDARSSRGDLRIAVEDPRELEVARLFSTGVAAHRSGDYTVARTAYERVLTLSPNYVDALNNLGVLLGTLREGDRAEQLLRRAVALDPTNPGTWNNFGTVLRERGRSGDAIAAFQHALSLDPGHPGARVSLAQQYLVIGSLAQARQLLEAVLAGNQDLPEANYALGQVLERLGDRQGAIRAYSTFLRIAPPSLAAYTDGVKRRVGALGSQKP